jgi:hypothetical protein
MRDLSSDDYASVVGNPDTPLIPESLRRLTGALLFLTLITTLALWSYRLGTRDAGEVPIIRAMDGPWRVEPEDPGGLQAAHHGLEVKAVLAGNPAPEPRTEATPEPEILAQEDSSQGALVSSAPQALAERVLNQGTEQDLPMPLAEVSAEDDFLAVPLSARTALTEDVLATDDPELQAATGPRPKNRPANLVVRPVKSPRPEVVRPAAAAAVVASAPATASHASTTSREVASAARGARLVQLGAFDSEAITRRAWQNLVARNPDLLASKSLYIERTTSNARVFYRLRVAGFDDTEQTRQMCEALRARGVDCIPVTLQ